MSAAASSMGPLDVLRWVTDSDLSLKVRGVLFGLLRFADARWTCWPSVGRLGKAAGITERHARFALRELEARGLVETEFHSGRVSQYQLRAEAMDPRKPGAPRPSPDRLAPLRPAPAPAPSRGATRLERLARVDVSAPGRAAVVEVFRRIAATGAAWPRDYDTDAGLDAAVEAFAEVFRGEDLSELLAGVTSWMGRSRFPWPRPFEVLAAARELRARRQAAAPVEASPDDLVRVLVEEARRVDERDRRAGDVLRALAAHPRIDGREAEHLIRQAAADYYRDRWDALSPEEQEARRRAITVSQGQRLRSMSASAREDSVLYLALHALQAEDPVLDPDRLVLLLE